MATTLDSRPTATTLDVEALVGMAWAGKIRVPHFQRDFRWGWEDVRRLFDSIVKGYPIGSLLLWVRKAPAQTLQLGALRIEAPASSDSLWVVDGQQRLTSLANALHPKGQSEARFALAYDLEAGEFVRTPLTENPLIIPLPVLFDLQEILKWFATHPGISDYLDRATNITRRIRQFEVPAYQVSQDDPRVLQDIFDRMNNYGKRLSRAEIFSALNAGNEADKDSALTFERIAARIDVDLGFGVIDNESVLGAVLARRGPEIRRDIRNEFTKADDEGRDAAYQAGEAALRRAVMFLQEDAGVPHVSMLAYRYILVVLARVFAYYPEPDARNTQLLRRWYWRAAVAGPERFKGGTANAARILCTKVTNAGLTESVQDLLIAVKQDNPALPNLERFSTNEASTKMLLCAMWAAGPRDPATARAYEQSDLAEHLTDQQTARDVVRYLVPRNSIPVEYRPWAANRALMPGLEVDAREITGLLSRQPLDLNDDQWLAMLGSHAITPDMTMKLAAGNVVDFILDRQEQLKQQAARFLEKMGEWNFEDTPPLSTFMLDDEDTDADDS
jgi:hypothetical protein